MVPSMIRVCDAIMGAGKTESAITQMNADSNSNYIFITPYLDEVDRIKSSCSGRAFKSPKNRGGGKLEDLHRLLRDKCNIASTHALFRTYNRETLDLIQDGGYKLILDEVCDVVEQIPISPKDMEILMGRNMIKVEKDGVVRWTKDDYEGRFDDLKEMCGTGNVILHNGCLMLWIFPVEVFAAFSEVTILTFMFDAQIQKYYFDIHGVQYIKIGTVCENGKYRFADRPNFPEYVTTLRDRIHILEDRVNEIGDGYADLSKSWYDRAGKVKGQPLLRQLKNNIQNIYRNKFCSPADKNLWTTFKNYQGVLKGKGYTAGFLPFNMRATNAYRNRDHLAYCANVFYNPIIKQYFVSHGACIKREQEEKYALSEMIQWIWRSSIRDGKEIWIYVPSKRMRSLLRVWLDSLANTKKE